ncbi:hypothetical protein SLA2020_515520 [Shorea laevis]
MEPESVESTMHLIPGGIEPHYVVRIDFGCDTSDPPSVIDIGINPIGDEEIGVRNRGWERPDFIGVNGFDKESRFVFRATGFVAYQIAVSTDGGEKRCGVVGAEEALLFLAYLYGLFILKSHC